MKVPKKYEKKKKRLFKIFNFFCLPFNQNYNLIISVNNKSLLHPRIHKLILEVLMRSWSKQKYFSPSAVNRQLVSFATKVGEKASFKRVKDNRSRDIFPTKRVLSLLFWGDYDEFDIRYLRDPTNARILVTPCIESSTAYVIKVKLWFCRMFGTVKNLC